jgi:hypothetical protein
MAKATAVFNSGVNGFRTAGNEPDTPFQILFVDAVTANTTYIVKTGTMLYVPVTFIDDSPPIIGNFPDVSNKKAVDFYVFDPSQIGTRTLEIEVDGQVTELDAGYVAAVTTPPLLDGGGTHYIVAAAFLTPLTKGTHHVTYRFFSQGVASIPFSPPDGIFAGEATYTVIVR